VNGCCCGCCCCCTSRNKKEQSEELIDNEVRRSQSTATGTFSLKSLSHSIDAIGSKLKKKDGWPLMERLFHNHFAPNLKKIRWFALLFFLVIFGFSIYSIITDIRPIDEPPDFFDFDHNLGGLMVRLILFLCCIFI
jgi:hypothetical protein